jgi:hypothetical protein
MSDLGSFLTLELKLFMLYMLEKMTIEDVTLYVFQSKNKNLIAKKFCNMLSASQFRDILRN